MSLAFVGSSTLLGVQAIPIDVEVDVSAGLPSFGIVGLGDTAVLEARDRVRAALRSSGFQFPGGRVTVNLAPAPVRKHGTGFDLPIAIGILVATGQLAGSSTAPMAVGELGLDGSVRQVEGLVAHAVCAEARGRRLLISSEGVAQTTLVPGAHVLPIDNLKDLGRELPKEAQRLPDVPSNVNGDLDLADVHGQRGAKRALEIAAAGGLGLLMIGAPGAGKTMLARRLPGILPPLTDAERLETALVHSVAGLDVGRIHSGVRPFRAPHHTATTAGLVGGGTPPRPGEASLAHNGVLFLDELPEFSPAALQALRQPLEDGHLTLVRAEGRVRYPARFMLIAAMNPCPCGYLGDSLKDCSCRPSNIDRYRNRVGGPLLDRIDMSIRVDRVAPGDLLVAGDGESSASVRKRVVAARATTRGRSGPTALSGIALLRACRLTDSTRALVESLARRNHLTGRGVTRLLRVSLAVADLAQEDRVTREHVLEAATYRLDL